MMNSTVNFRHIYRINDCCAIVVSTIANILFLYLIIRKTPKEMRIYKNFLFLACFVDMFLIITTAIAEPIIVFKNGYEIMLNNGFFRGISTNLDFSLIAIYLLSLGFSYCSITIPFIYRYFLLVKNRHLSGTTFIALVFVLLIIDAINVALCGISYYPAEEKIQLSKEILRGYFVENDFDDVSAGFVGSSNRFDFSWIVTFDILLLTAGGYAVVVWCNAKIWYHIKKEVTMITSLTGREINIQLHRALIAQAIGPLAINGIPMLTFVYCFASKNDAIVLSSWIGLPIAWIPLVNPVLTIWFVKPYRRALFNRKIQPEANRKVYSIPLSNVLR